MKLTVRNKLLTGFAVIGVLLITLSVIMIIYIKEIDTSYTDIVDRRAEVRGNMKDVVIQTYNQALSMRGVLLMQDQASNDDLLASNENVTKIIDDTRGMLQTQEYLDIMDELEQYNQQYLANYEAFKKEVSNRPIEERIAYWQKNILPIGSDMIDLASNTADKTTKTMVEVGNENQKKVGNIILIVSIISGITLILAIVIGVIISNMISKPLIRITEETKRIAAGDLTVEDIQVKNKDELGVLASSFNQMVQTLKNLIYQVNASTEQVASSSEELMASAEQTTQATNQITAAIQKVASGAKTQEQSVGESAKAIQEMADGIQRVATATATVAEESKETTREANEGDKSIQKVIEQMDKIHGSVDDTAKVIQKLEERSKEIGQIIEVITGISDQTNLLALNAAIEAARAGEHGKGFAVVADEVKNLAEQSKESADKIANLIQQIQRDTTHAVEMMGKGTADVAEGISVVQVTGEGFKRIQQSIDQVTSQIQEISAVSEEMSASVEQVHASIDQVALIVKEASTNTENIAAASEEQLASMEEITTSSSSLSTLAEDLLVQVKQFKM